MLMLGKCEEKFELPRAQSGQLDRWTICSDLRRKLLPVEQHDYWSLLVRICAESVKAKKNTKTLVIFVLRKKKNI